MRGLTVRWAAAAVLLGACATPDWGAFAESRYVDRAAGNGGRDEHGWFIAVGRRAPESIVRATDARVPRGWREIIADSARGRGVNARLIAAFDTATVIRWNVGSGSGAVELRASVPGESATDLEIFADAAQALVTVPSHRDVLSAVLWVEEDRATVVRWTYAVDEDVETPASEQWFLQDVIDHDRDGAPDLVIVEAGFESSRISIVSVVEGRPVTRWTGLARGL